MEQLPQVLECFLMPGDSDWGAHEKNPWPIDQGLLSGAGTLPRLQRFFLLRYWSAITAATMIAPLTISW